MLTTASSASPLLPASPDRNAVLQELERLLAHTAFRKSVRCTKLMRYLVEQALTNPDFQPKERTLAIEVFGRSPNYDTAADPVVRTTANEIRKRLGAYYHDTGPEAAVLIELRSGSYWPTFRTIARPELTAGGADPAPVPGLARALPTRRAVRFAALGGALVLVLVAALTLWPRLFPSNADRFWHPFLFSSRRVLVCPPNPDFLTETAQDGQPGQAAAGNAALQQTPMLPVSDSKAVWRVMSVLDKQQQNIIIRTSDRVRATDFQDGPAIIIGGPNNDWSTRALSNLRFQIVANEPASPMQIVDRSAPSDHTWSVDTRASSPHDSRVYALISRIIDTRTQNVVLNIAGIGMYGTAAAAEFIAEPSHLNSLGGRMKGCSSNMQLVFSAQFINGNMSEPKVEAIHCW